MSFNLTLSDVPTHIVLWRGDEAKKESTLSHDSELIKSLVERITTLEKLVDKLMNQELLSGLTMRRRENSIGSLSAVQDSDTTKLFQVLIEKPFVQQNESEFVENMGVSMLNTAFDLGDDGVVEDEVIEEEVEEEEEELVEEEEEEVVEEEVEVEEEEVEVEEVEVEEEEVEVEEVEVEEEEVEVEEVEVEEEEEEVEEEEEEEEEALELDEFEYKGVTYFRDAENKVYQIDTDGDLDDTPIGIWSVEKGKVLRYAK